MASLLLVFFCLIAVYYADITSAGEGDTALIPPPPEDYKILNKQKVAVLSGNVVGYQEEGQPTTLKGRGFRFTVQKYVNSDKGECVKLVTVRRLNKGDILDQAKISCEYAEPNKKRGFNLHIDTVIYESPLNSMIFVVKDGVCRKRSYSTTGEEPKVEDEPLSDGECDNLTNKSKKKRTSGVIPEAQLISSKDINVMDKQIVAVLEGNLKDFTPEEPEPVFSTSSKLFQVHVQEFKKNKQCVKVVSFKRKDHDQYFDSVKVSCKITKPKIVDDEDIELNYGNLIYLLNRSTAVFVIKDGICLERTYSVKWSEIDKKERTLSKPDCYHLTRWRAKSRRSAAKLNQEPPPKTTRAPGFMWLLALDGERVSGYKMGPGYTHMGGRDMFMHSQDYHKGEECFRLLDVRMYGVQVDQYKVSCGPMNAVVNGQSIQYGKAFVFKPKAETDDFIALFNFRDKPCIKRIYTIKKGDPTTVTKSNDEDTEEEECSLLKGGKSLLNIQTLSTMGIMNFDNIADETQTVVSERESTVSDNNKNNKDKATDGPVGWVKGLFSKIWS